MTRSFCIKTAAGGNAATAETIDVADDRPSGIGDGGQKIGGGIGREEESEIDGEDEGKEKDSEILSSDFEKEDENDC